MSSQRRGLSQRHVLVFGIYLMVLSLVLIYVLIRIWPATLPPTAEDKVSLLWGGRLQFDMPPETRYLIIVVVSGALGSYIHLATSFADFVGNRRFEASWTWWYLLRPFIGMALAVLVYFVVRGDKLEGE